MENSVGPSRSILDLSLALQSRIIAEVSRGNNHSLEHALVCRQWSHLARVATKSLQITSEKCITDHSTLLQELSPWAPGLQSLTLKPGGKWSRNDVEMSESAVTELLQLCQGLSGLRMDRVSIQDSLEGQEEEERGRREPFVADGDSEGRGNLLGRSDSCPPWAFQLKFLSLDHDCCSPLLPLLSRLPHLRTLRLHIPPSDIKNLGTWCPDLRVLHLGNVREPHLGSFWGSHGPLRLPPSISLLVQLRELRIRCQRIEAFPKELSSLTSLRKCYVVAFEISSSSRSLPPSLSLFRIRAGSVCPSLHKDWACLHRLQSLDLNLRNLHALPNAITSLSRLKELRLRCCSMEGGSALDPAVFPHLTTLHMECRVGEQVPSSLSSLSNLKDLSLSGTFVEIPVLNLLSCLEHLGLKGKFRAVPDLPCFGTLHALTLESGFLERVLPQDAVLPRLKTLSVHGHWQLPALSQEHWDLPNLRVLSMGKLSSFADALPVSLGSSKGLTRVTLAGLWDSFPSDILESSCSLRRLDLEKVYPFIKEDYTLSLDNLTLLEELSVSCWQLGLLRLGTESQLPQLRMLQVPCNESPDRPCYDSTILPLWLTQLPNLTVLKVSGSFCLLSFPISLLESPKLDTESLDVLNEIARRTEQDAQA